MGDEVKAAVKKIADRLGFQTTPEMHVLDDIEASTLGKVQIEAGTNAVFLQYRDEQTAIKAAGGSPICRNGDGTFMFRLEQALEKFVIGLIETGADLEKA